MLVSIFIISGLAVDMSSVIKKFFIASMFMWAAPVAILYGFNHNILPGNFSRKRPIAHASLNLDYYGTGSTHLSSYSMTLLSGFLAVISVNIVIACYICMAMKEPSDKHEPDPAFLASAKASLSQKPNEAEDSTQTRQKEE
ncbi:hypothetical protein RHSIM_Rhsim12G0144200 [Rhododendron simsii]|uniref:Vacuolar ATPase assembly integral membrane protein VMA21 homolog n=1 Tax=Rhododendron simsii TaxID=118357 RepID=A0A834G2K3_RHOSS|nr:hypothetical protein RHSIM_Rhsim12G0144200 [Rhododendron simsii]